MTNVKTVREKLTGVFAPICTPFDRNDEVDYEGLAHNVRKSSGSGMTGYFALGTNGEYKTLSERESLKVLETVVKHASDDMVIMAGSGAESTKLTIEITKAVAEVGAELVSLLMPHFFAKKITDDVMAAYIFDVAEASPVPVVLYNNPSVAAGVTMRASLVERVAEHPNVVGIKDSSKETYPENLSFASESFFVMAGSASFFLDLLKQGGTGGVLSLANVIPQACAELHRLFVNGKIDEAEELNTRLVALNKQVSGTYGVAGVKAAMDAAGFVGGSPRKPLTGLAESERAALGKIISDSALLP
ncbi:MAG: dihydrodipicolinate synthase family protein [Spirochaetaceae bacterium]|nr:MAG: dihydrodipicolinate synthase family protein [Spirochaetaceae bacterium]